MNFHSTVDSSNLRTKFAREEVKSLDSEGLVLGQKRICIGKAKAALSILVNKMYLIECKSKGTLNTFDDKKAAIFYLTKESFDYLSKALYP